MRTPKIGHFMILGVLVYATTAMTVPSAVSQEAGEDSIATQGPKERIDEAPEDLEGVDIVEKLDNQLPLDTPLVDENGEEVKLGNFFQGDKPVILNLGYYRCPMLCGLVSRGMLEALKEISMTPGQDFEIVTISIDPLETPQLAKHKKNTYIKEYGRPAAANGWHFLTGKEKNLRSVADAVGFQYKYNDDREEYAHGSAIFIITPEGHVSRYLYGITYDPKTLRLSMVEASEGKIGNTIDRVLLYCYHFDETKGKYAPVAMNIMRMGGGLTMVILLIVLAIFWRREIKRKQVV